MSDAEKALLKQFAADIADKYLPALLDAEVAKVPASYQPLVAAIEMALKPALQAYLDAKIAAM